MGPQRDPEILEAARPGVALVSLSVGSTPALSLLSSNHRLLLQFLLTCVPQWAPPLWDASRSGPRIPRSQLCPCPTSSKCSINICP